MGINTYEKIGIYYVTFEILKEVSDVLNKCKELIDWIFVIVLKIFIKINQVSITYQGSSE